MRLTTRMRRALALLLAVGLAAALLACPAAAASAPWVEIGGKGTDTQTVSLRGLEGQYTSAQLTLDLDSIPGGFQFEGVSDAQSYATFRVDAERNRVTLYVTSKLVLNQGDSLLLGTLQADKAFTVRAASGLKLLNVGSGNTQAVTYDRVSMEGGSEPDPGPSPSPSPSPSPGPAPSSRPDRNPGSDPSPAAPSYSVTAADGITGGSLRISETRAKQGQTVTVTATAGPGYVLSAVTVTDKAGRAVAVTGREDGTWSFVMPGSAVTVNAVFAEEQPEPLPFTDVGERDWFHEAVDYVYRTGLMSGTGGTTFSPGTATTRGMVVTILHRYEGKPAAEPSGFPDVPSGKYYTEAVAWAAANGVVSGYDNGLFMPDQEITREQMAAILYRYARYKGVDVSGRADLSAFPDAGRISGYAVDAMAWANHAGLISGMGDHTLQPRGSATRAQVAAILMRFCKSING